MPALDQSAVDGWQSLGTFAFADGGSQWIRVADNTGEPLADKVQLAFDAVRVTRVEEPSTTSVQPEDETGGCNAGGHQLGIALGLMLFGLRRRKK